MKKNMEQASATTRDIVSNVMFIRHGTKNTRSKQLLKNYLLLLSLLYLLKPHPLTSIWTILARACRVRCAHFKKVTKIYKFFPFRFG